MEWHYGFTFQGTGVAREDPRRSAAHASSPPRPTTKAREGGREKHVCTKAPFGSRAVQNPKAAHFYSKQS